MERHIYPFTAIIGQDQMKKALIFNAIDPAIGGVLIRGENPPPTGLPSPISFT